jgi:glycosyltransferase 2 family protein
MRLSVTNDREPPPPRRIDKVAIIAVKLLVTGVCFWYLSRQIDLSQVFSSIPLLEFRWAALATLMVMLQIPLVAMRWREILHVLAAIDQRMTNTSIIAITAIGVFFAQVLPSVMGEGIRAWLLVRLGCDWRSAVTSVVIDRGVGAGLLIALGFVILLLPSGLSALGGYRGLVLMVYGALLLAGALVLLLLPRLIPLLDRVPYLRWMAGLAANARRVVLGPKSFVILGLACLIHALTILIIWSLGRAQGLVLPISDAAVLFVVVVGVALVPVSINGWGLRELAVVALLGRHGVAPEQALVFSVCFGLVLAVGSLPGALAWLLYSVAPAKRSIECSR